IFDPNEYFEFKEENRTEIKSEDKNNLDKINDMDEVKDNDKKQIENEKYSLDDEVQVTQLRDDTKGDNFVAVGDWSCNEETKNTINNILDEYPDLIITTGDHVKKVPSASCWINMTEPIKDKMKIAIGNHDAEFATIYKQIADYHQIDNPYYSHDFENIHFISMSTEHPYVHGSKQYDFIKDDLKKASKDSYIEWIIIHQHKAFYSTKQDKKEAKDLRETYHQLFQEYGVDMVLSSHNQYYERTFPILYNEEFENTSNKSVKPKPLVTSHSKSYYQNPEGIIFLTVGTAGDKLDKITEKPNFYAIQTSQFGFLKIHIENSGKTLRGEFHTNDGKIIDKFYLDKHNL
ncbi:MAG: metallophosphoesterase, partial [Nitrososphaeraceae archaeon]